MSATLGLQLSRPLSRAGQPRAQRRVAPSAPGKFASPRTRLPARVSERAGRAPASIRMHARSSAVASASSQAFDAAPASPRARRVAIFVEPSPFSHTSGMKNRFLNLIINLREAGDEVLVITPDANPPKEYHGAEVMSVLGFPLPFYRSDTLRLSTALSPFVYAKLRSWKPDVLHVAVPGSMVFAVMMYAKLLKLPLVTSYHTHIPQYIKDYTWRGLEEPMWALIRLWSRVGNLMLVTSAVMRRELGEHACSKLDVWMRGVDTELFNPKHKSAEFKRKMAGGKDAPVIAYIGRLGAEKNLKFCRDVLERIPGATLCFVGDGPQRAELEEYFKGTRTTFLGMLSGEPLHQAFASADVFLMPSESETLGFVVLEAMASGVPVVAVAAGGIVDIITEPGKSGLLYQPGDLEAATAHVRSLLEDGAKAQAMSAYGRQEVEKWGWGPATRFLREKQYPLAIRRFAAERRFGGLLHKLHSERSAAWTLVSVFRRFYDLHSTTAVIAAALVVVVAWGAPAPVHAKALVESTLAAAAAAVVGPKTALALLTTVIAAMGAVPLVPMQPLAAAVGYALGARLGGLFAWGSIVAAAVVAFWAARLNGRHFLAGVLPLGVARPFLQNQLSQVEASVRSGSRLGTAFEVMKLRLRPLAPFSLSNYLLVGTGAPGVSYALGTAVGIAPWCFLYATLGATVRAAIEAGVSPRELLQRITVNAPAGAAALPYSELIGVAIVALVALLWGRTRQALSPEVSRGAR